MKKENRETGRMGEAMAVRALLKKGYEILEQNYANKFGEIDIIAKDKGALVFVEVKTKKGREFGEPEEMVGRGKLRKVRLMGEVYMQDQVVPCRIDVVAIVLNETNELLRLTHYENVY